jgi:hypothetical protein
VGEEERAAAMRLNHAPRLFPQNGARLYWYLKMHT